MRFWSAVTIRLLAPWVRRADDERLERRFGSESVQRAMFAAMAAGFDPRAADGFQGRLVYELTRPATRRPPISWTLEVVGRRAVARPGATEDAAVTVRLRLSDFVRIAAGTLDPAIPMLHNRATLEGDFGLATRMPEMFRAPRVR
jgi:hypothetical protein